MDKHHHHQAHHDKELHQTKSLPNSIYAIPFFLIFAFALLEFFGGIWTNSLALLSDAWHMFSDLFALGLAWFAAFVSAKPGTHRHASGQSHLEIAASVVNVILMFAVVTYIIIEAIQRFNHPQLVTGGYVIFIALAGLVVNLMVLKMLHGDDGHAHGAEHNHNKRAAYLHVMGDLLGSVAAVAAGAVIYFTGWLLIDPILSIFISLLILVVTIKLSKDIWTSYKNG
ncbi:MAG: cation diffusion facilitator family transporter [Pseudomonadota bacterium]